MIPTTHLSLLENLNAADKREEAWCLFHAAYGPVILRWCRTRSYSESTAEDLASDVFLKLLRSMQEYQHDPSRGKFRQWLKTVVKNAATDYFRKQQNRLDRHLVEPSLLAEMPSENDLKLLSKELHSESERREKVIVDRVKARIDAATWVIFQETELHGRAARDVADEKKVTVSYVYKARKRVIDMLRQEALTHV